MTHWLARVAETAGFDHTDDLRLEAHLGVPQAWARVLDVCGIDSHELAAAVGRFFHVSVADLGDAEATAVKLLPESVARKLQAVPLRDLNRRLLVAVADPTDPVLEHEIGFASGRTPALQVAAPDEIAAALERGYGQDAVVETFLSGIRDSAADVVQIHAEEAEAEGIRPQEVEARPIVNLVNMILDEAVKQGASDIHLQPHDKQGVVRFRVDGVLRTAAKLPLPVLPRVVSRVKVLGNLDIADRLRAQDGRVRVTCGSPPCRPAGRRRPSSACWTRGVRWPWTRWRSRSRTWGASAARWGTGTGSSWSRGPPGRERPPRCTPPSARSPTKTSTS